MNNHKINLTDPIPPNWHDQTLPDSWSDQYNLANPVSFLKVLSLAMKKKRQRVKLPESLIGKEIIPTYAQQEFHNIPNGNYSNILASGYIKGFDIAMLGHMKQSRKQIAKTLHSCNSVLDIGCGGGRTARILADTGITDTWGIDISPYLLKQAAIRNPTIKFIHAKAENLPFRNQRFDGISCCYVLHEVPPKYIDQALSEIYRVLTPNGLCVFVEPSPIHYYGQYWPLFKQYKFKGIYFRFLSHFVYEPFVQSWHKLDFESLLKSKSFEVIQTKKETPNYLWVARKTV
ncbi:class I SAM-dependent methyltransferase [Thiotrichales bacterium 19S3-7]|nr:class I SAM-dependent methyltransferase [Thiotrichales bacterium 19S3-7]MCF6802949.1 class I SAM-dependent methyltransferase [Thiotrichales bacterium 19S3-11]